MPFRRIFKRQYRSRAVEWAVIYTLYLFVALGLIVASAITIRNGSKFFPAVDAAATNGAAGTGTTGNADAGGEAEEGADGAPLSAAVRRKDALILSDVMGSIGLASGIVALVLNLASFIVQTWLNSRWESSQAKEKIYGSKLYSGLLIFSVNLILCGGNIALCWGFAQASADVKRETIGTGAATASYLRASAVMAGLVALMALATAIADYLSLRSAEKELDGRMDATQKKQKQQLSLDTDIAPAKAD